MKAVIKRERLGTGYGLWRAEILRSPAIAVVCYFSTQPEAFDWAWDWMASYPDWLWIRNVPEPEETPFDLCKEI